MTISFEFAIPCYWSHRFFTVIDFIDVYCFIFYFCFFILASVQGSSFITPTTSSVGKSWSSMPLMIQNFTWCTMLVEKVFEGKQRAWVPDKWIYLDHNNVIAVIGHFRVPKTLTFITRSSAQPFMWKWVLFAWEWQIISISKAEHLTSFWNRGSGELRNGLLDSAFVCYWRKHITPVCIIIEIIRRPTPIIIQLFIQNDWYF